MTGSAERDRAAVVTGVLIHAAAGDWAAVNELTGLRLGDQVGVIRDLASLVVGTFRRQGYTAEQTREMLTEMALRQAAGDWPGQDEGPAE